MHSPTRKPVPRRIQDDTRAGSALAAGGVRNGRRGLGCACERRGLGGPILGVRGVHPELNAAIIDPSLGTEPETYTLDVESAAAVPLTFERRETRGGDDYWTEQTIVVPGVRVWIKELPSVYSEWPLLAAWESLGFRLNRDWFDDSQTLRYRGARNFWPHPLATAAGRFSAAQQKFERALQDEANARALRGKRDSAWETGPLPPDLQQAQYTNDQAAQAAFLGRVPVYVQGPSINLAPAVLARYDAAAGYPVPVIYSDAAARQAVIAAGLRPASLKLWTRATQFSQQAVLDAYTPAGTEQTASAVYQFIQASANQPAASAGAAAASGPVSNTNTPTPANTNPPASPAYASTPVASAGFVASSIFSALTQPRTAGSGISPVSLADRSGEPTAQASTSAPSGRGGLLVGIAALLGVGALLAFGGKANAH